MWHRKCGHVITVAMTRVFAQAIAAKRHQLRVRANATDADVRAALGGPWCGVCKPGMTNGKVEEAPSDEG